MAEWPKIRELIDETARQTGMDGGCSNFTVQSFACTIGAAVESVWMEREEDLARLRTAARRLREASAGDGEDYADALEALMAAVEEVDRV